MDLRLRGPVQQTQGRGRGAAAEAGEEFQRLLRGGGQTVELAKHEFDHVVGEFLGADAADVPGPGAGVRIEREQALVGQHGDELDREEGIAAGFFAYQFCQAPRVFSLAVQSIGDEPFDVVQPERCEHDVAHRHYAGAAHRVQRARQRMQGVDLAIPERADQQQGVQVRIVDQIGQQVERGSIQPLQIIQEQHERMLRPREHAQKAPKHGLKTVLRFLRRQLLHRRLLADEEFQLGNEFDEERPIRAQRALQCLPPPAHLRFALAEDLAHQSSECLGQRGIRDVALVLIELAGGKETALRDERLVQFAHHRRLADAGIAGNHHQLGRAAGDDPVKGGDQERDFGLAPIEFFRNQQLGGGVMRAEREGVDVSLRCPLRQAAAQIGFQAGSSLVALLGRFGKQLHDEGRDLFGNAGRPLGGRYRLSSEVAMEQFHRVRGGKRQHAGQHFIERHAQRVKVAAGIDRAVHAAGLLGRHVGERASDFLGRRESLALARLVGGNAEARQMDRAGAHLDQHVGRLDVLVNDAARVQSRQRGRQRAGDAQEQGDLHGLPKKAVERLAAGVGKHEHQAPAPATERQRANRPLRIELVAQRILAREPLKAGRPGMLLRRCLRQLRGSIRLPHPVQDELRVAPHDLELPAWRCHG